MELIDFGARRYDPRIGRFISPDTIIPDPANPQSLNRYSYAVNNPLKYVDPTGHSFRLPCFVCKLKIDVSGWPDSGKKAAGLVVNLTIGGKYDAEQDAIVGPTPQEWIESGVTDLMSPAPLGTVTGKAGKLLKGPLKGEQLPLPGLEKMFRSGSWPDRLAKLPIQTHHILSNKHDTQWTKLFNDIIEPYGLELHAAWNTIDIPHQPRRHPNAYHEWVHDQIRNINELADGSKEKFLELFNERVKKQVEEHPEMLFNDYWE